MTQSLGVYVPTVIMQKLVGLGRMLVFLYLMRQAIGEFNHWGLGTMIFTIAAPLLALGANQGLVRYVALYENRGQLALFVRSIALPLGLIALVTTILALVASRPITALVIATHEQAGQVTQAQLLVCRLALLNGLMLALYNNVLALMYGLRTYKLASMMELSFTVLFTAMAIPSLAIVPSGSVALGCHLIALLVATGIGAFLLHLAIRPPGIATALDAAALGQAQAANDILPSASREAETIVALPGPLVHPNQPSPQVNPLGKVLSFGLVALAGSGLWTIASYVSYFLVNKFVGVIAGGVFAAWMQLAQPVLFISNAAWAVAFSHVVKRWEDRQVPQAMESFQTAYKLLGLLTMTLSVGLYVSADSWSQLLPESWRGGLELLGGLLMFGQAMTALSLLTVLSRLHERPSAIALGALCAGAANVMLALWWIPMWGAAGGSWAAGVGLLAGGGAAAVAYVLISRTPLQLGTWVMLAVPALLLLGPVAAAAAWLAVLILTAASNVILSRQQKSLLWNRLGWRR